MGLYEFYRGKLPGERKYFDMIPALVEKKYLKTVIACLDCAECLDAADLDGDGEITVLAIDYALRVHGGCAGERQ